MKIIQSFWSKPFRETIVNRNPLGWPEKKYAYFSQALSCLRAREHYTDLTLVTDEGGKRVLIDLLELPYTEVTEELEAIEKYPGAMWSIKNLYTYSIQQAPFIHIDGDVFLQHQIDDKGGSIPLLAINPINIHSPIIKDLLNEILHFFGSGQPYLKGPSSPLFTILNCGILGGQDLPAIRQFAKDSLSNIDAHIEFVNDNAAFSVDPFNREEIHILEIFNTLIESYQFSHYIKSTANQVECLTGTTNVVSIRETHKILHSGIMADLHPIFTDKRSVPVCNKLEYYLRHHYPDYYYRIDNYIKDLKI